MDIIAITISTKYDDLLPHVIKANKKFLKHWIFITDKNDTQTIDILKQYKNITILYFDFQEGDRIFNKGGAIKLGQEYAYNNFPDDWYLIIDSDICLQDNFIECIKNESPLLEDYIYGSKDRKDYSNIQDYINKKNFSQYSQIMNALIIGYFQLYKKKLYYDNSTDCSSCDIVFSNNFFNNKHLLNMTCSHLGCAGYHWQGRKDKTDFQQ